MMLYVRPVAMHRGLQTKLKLDSRSGNFASARPVSSLTNQALRLILPLLALPALAQQAPQVTPRDLRPETPLAAPATLPQPAPASAVAPLNASQLFVQPADIVVADGFPELAVATEAMVSAVRGHRKSVADFYDLAEGIESLYRAAGYPLVRVTLPPQQVKDGGTLRLLVVDGYIERIDATAVDARARAQVQALLDVLKGRRHLDSEALERALTLASRSPGLALRSTLRAGSAPGATVLVVDGAQRLVSGVIGADNRLSDSLGPWQSNAQLSLNQALGLGEYLYVNASSGADIDTAYRGSARRRVAGLGAVFPVGTSGLALNPEYTYSTSAPRPLPFTPATRSRFERATLRVLYPMILTRRQELALTASYEAISQLDTLPEYAYTLDHDRLRVVRLGAAWSRILSEQSQFSLGGTLSRGGAGLGARGQEQALASGIPLSRPRSRPDFMKIEANAALDLALPADLQSRSVLRLQKTLNGVLPSAELFNIDGEDALSSFTAGALADDSGATLRQEFSRAYGADWRGFSFGATPYAFGALGKGWNALGAAKSQGLGHAFGLGLRLRWNRVGISLEYGRGRVRNTRLDRQQLSVKAQVPF
jgi:hemolysin activation/secretion protein